MNNTQIIDELKAYAINNIRTLAKHDRNLTDLASLLDTIEPTLNNKLLTDDEAQQLTQWKTQDEVTEPFSKQDIDFYHIIAKMILQLAVNPSVNNTNLQLVAKYLHPLLSLDSRTSAIGWDLEEYMDWYFSDTSEQERRQYANELAKDWKLDATSF